jgi:ribosomal protein S18 acetylase RimI-like enzyme
MVFRELTPADLPACFRVRASVRENPYSIEALAKAGITEASVTQMLAATHKGWVCEADGQVVGFAMGNRSNGELWVVAVLPEHEGRGIGRRLVELVQDWLFAGGCAEVWLWTSPNVATRAYHLYRKLGWRDCGVQSGQRIMRLNRDAA